MGFRYRERTSKESATRTNFLESTVSLIKKREVIPIISNSFRIEQIFYQVEQFLQAEGDKQEQAVGSAHGADTDRTIEELLTKEWAISESVSYPMPDRYNLAQIAQYHQIETKDIFQAKADYTNFLKDVLLYMSQQDQEYGDLAKALEKEMNDLRFSEIVRQLDYPRFAPGVDDPLRLLAKLPLPVYITTSYYTFLEQALEAEDKNPQTRVCYWERGTAGIIPEQNGDHEFLPAPDKPIVYHLFGIEDNAQTMVLSEDDYMKFLVSMAKDTDTQHPILPLTLREGLANKRLLLLGYQLRDWDFRVLFRFISGIRGEISSNQRSMVIQLKPDHKRIGSEEKSRKYLSDYFDRHAFHFEWIDTQSFVQNLWNEWKGRS